MTMTKHVPLPSFRMPLGRHLRALALLLAVLMALPAGTLAQDGSSRAESVADSTRARIRAAREARRAGRPLPGRPVVDVEEDEAEDDSDAPADAPITARSFTPDSPIQPAGTNAEGEELYTLNLKDAPLDLLLENYSRMTGRTMIKAPGVNGTFTFKAYVSNGRSELTRAEMIQAMDALLTMNNISLVPLGNRFYRVVPIGNAPNEGMVLTEAELLQQDMQSDALLRLILPLKYLDMEDAANIVQPMLHSFGKVQRQDRIRSLMIIDTAANLKIILDVLKMVDQPTELNVETRIYQIKHAKASDIAARLNELVSDSQEGQKEQTPVVRTPGTRRYPDMTRARRPLPPEDAAAEAAASAAAQAKEMAEKGIITGKVKVLVDERTNIIIVISNPLNFTFFDQIVNVLDVEVDPEVTVEVVNLEFADAEEMASLLNDFIGAAQDDDKTTPSSQGATPGEPSNERSRALSDVAEARAAAATRIRATAGEAAATRIGQLSSNTKILADTRTNTILLMGTKGDIAALQEVIKKVDIMLAQVLIEAVILEVTLNDSSDTGVSWLQKSMTAYNTRISGNGTQIKTPVVSWGGAFNGSGGSGSDSSAYYGDSVRRGFSSPSGLTYLFSFAELNIDAVLSMVAQSSETRVLATPVILTTDNTEASIMSGEQVPIRTGSSSSGSGYYYSDYDYKDVGIQLKVKPRINPSRYVTLEITQSADTLGTQVDMGEGAGVQYSINKREMTASVSVPSRSTIVLGGLVQTMASRGNTRIPILGSIPLLGALFRSNSKENTRTELLVLITPYVLVTPDEARAETERLHAASNVSAEDWYRGWSDSTLAPFSPADLKAERDARNAEAAKRRREQWKAAAEQYAPAAATTTNNAEAASGDAGTAAPAGDEAAPVLILSPDDPSFDVPMADPTIADPAEYSRAVQDMMETPAAPLATDVPDSAAPFAVNPAGQAPSDTLVAAAAAFAAGDHAESPEIPASEGAAAAPAIAPESAPGALDDNLDPPAEKSSRRSSRRRPALLSTRKESTDSSAEYPSMFPAPNDD